PLPRLLDRRPAHLDPALALAHIQWPEAHRGAGQPDDVPRTVGHTERRRRVLDFVGRDAVLPADAGYVLLRDHPTAGVGWRRGRSVDRHFAGVDRPPLRRSG